MFRILVKTLIFKEDKLLLIKRKGTSDFAGGCWDIPGGKLEFKETPEYALKREVYEETGLDINIKDIVSVSSGINEERNKQYISIVYLCRYKSGDMLLSDEHIDYVWLNLDEAKNYEKIYYLEDALNNLKKKTNKI